MLEKILEDIIAREGGYVHHVADRGGPTKYGITLRTLSSYLDRHVTEAEIKALDRNTAKAILRTEYYQKPQLDKLPPTLWPVMLDMATHHGPVQAIKLLQQALNQQGNNLRVDGKLGVHTIRAAKKAASENDFMDAVVEQRRRFLQNIVHRDASQQIFLHGWIARAEAFRRLI